MHKLFAAFLLIVVTTLAPSAALAGNKSHVPGSRDGTYVPSNGGSHKTHYVNPDTGNHYRDRVHGVPY